MYNIVTNSQFISELKKSRYFKINLGLAATVDVGNGRVFDKRDKFAYFYNMQYSTTIYGQGNIGDIKFYTDVYINKPIIAIYVGDDFEEFIMEIDYNILQQKTIDSYLGYILKNVDEQLEERIKNKTTKVVDEKPIGDPNLLTINPGSVKFEDIQAYIQKQKKL
ncbi:MAG: hypothetical protein M0R46_17715 [Candidatus Muirbacterium halophilum]|nr:hypothetical protein [Candidatus Muirbacterium halophilum]